MYQGTLASDLFEPQDIKTRTQSFSEYQAGEVKESFVHITAKILSGRNLEQRRALSQSILSQLESLNLCRISLTVEVVEIEKESYAKVVK